MNRTLKYIFKAFEMMNRCWDGADGATGNGDDDKAPDDSKTVDDDKTVDDKMTDDNKDDDTKDDDTVEDKLTDEEADEYNIPPELRDDPTVIESVRQTIKAQEDHDAEHSDDDDKDKDKDKDTDDDKDKDTKDKDAVDDKDKDKDAKDTKEEEYDLKFEEDVTIGDMEFKKEDLATTPKKILENIATIHAQLETANAELELSKSKNTDILNDPIVKERIARINEGKADEPYDYYIVSKDTENYLIDAFDLDPEIKEDKEKLDGLFKEIQADIQDNVEKIVNNSLTRNSQIEEGKAITKKGMENILSIQDKYIDKKYHIKETDLNKLWKQKDKHPEWEKFNSDKGLAKIQKTLVETGFKNYSQVANMEADTLYAIAATKLKLPLTLNTKDRDREIIKKHEAKLLDLFKPKKVAKALGSSVNAAAKKKNSILGESVVDDDKLMDHDYIQSLYDSAKDEEELMQMKEEISAKLSKRKVK